jgi:hypothetical protein
MYFGGHTRAENFEQAGSTKGGIAHVENPDDPLD